MKRLASLVAFILPMLFVASIASAQTGDCVGSLCSPLNPAVSTLSKFVEFALKALVMVALPIISFFIVYSGFLFVSARGNEGQLSEAKQNFYYVIVGTILILGAWVIATIIGGTVAQLTA